MRKIGVDPVAHRPLRITKHRSDPGTGNILRRQQNRVEFVIVAGFVISSDLVLKYQSGCRIVDSECHV